MRTLHMPISLFYSYSHADEVLQLQLEKHLSLLERQGLILPWHDRAISPGDEWAMDIDEHLNTASIILLLISADFLASDYCYEKEVRRALERHAHGEARVIPIILRPCDWQNAPFGKLQALPRSGKAVTEWDNQDRALHSVSTELRYMITQTTSPQLASTDKQNRRTLLKRVRKIWIEDVLEHSLQRAAWLKLNLQEQSDALENPWHLAVQETNLPSCLLPPETSIIQIYDEAEGELLILGEPGAGKTTLLLELARTLLKRVEDEEQELLPIIFNLSSWIQKRQPIADWLVEELAIKYEIPRVVSKNWIKANQVLPLLDGLDEVAENARSNCIQAIMTYRSQRMEEHLSAPMVICCRSQEYKALPSIRLRKAVSIQLLTDEQIEDYLQRAKNQLEGLRQALHEDPELYKLARFPLMLSVFTLAYQGVTREDVPLEQTHEEKQRHAFAFYIKRMLEHRGVETHYTDQQTMHWLSWLAWQMKQHNQREFYLEQMQPSWLPHGRGYRVAFASTLVVVTGLTLVLSSIILNELQIFFFGSVLEQLYKPNPLWLIALLAQLPTAVIAGAITGVIAFQHRKQIKPVESISWSWEGMYQGLRQSKIAKIVVICTVLYDIFVAVSIGLFTEIESVILRENIPWFEVLSKEFLALPAALYVAIPWLMLIGILAGWFNVSVRKSLFIKPNQGIHNSARYSLLVGTLSWLICSMFLIAILLFTFNIYFGPIIHLINKVLGNMQQTALTSALQREQTAFNLLINPFYSMYLGLALGMMYGLIVGLVKGGFACIQHLILRVQLLRTGVLPWDYPRFLNYAANRLLLLKVGGGYMFVHGLLLEYFASQITTVAPISQQQNELLSTSSPREDISPLKQMNTSQAVPDAFQVNTSYYEEMSPSVPLRRKVSFNKGKLFRILFAVFILLASLCNIGMLSVFQQFIQRTEATTVAQSQANTTAVAEASSLLIIYPPKNILPVLDDPLHDNSRGNNWEVDVPSKGNCKFINQAYDINTNLSEWCVYRGKDFTNFIYEMQMKIVKGNEGGLIFCVDPANEYQNFYEFTINRDGSYHVYTSISNFYSPDVITQGFSSAIHRGLYQTNLVTAVVYGKLIGLFVNHQRVAVVGRRTHTYGRIGVSVKGSQGNQTEVIFQNAKVWGL